MREYGNLINPWDGFFFSMTPACWAASTSGGGRLVRHLGGLELLGLQDEAAALV